MILAFGEKSEYVFSHLGAHRLRGCPIQKNRGEPESGGNARDGFPVLHLSGRNRWAIMAGEKTSPIFLFQDPACGSCVSS